MTRFSRRDFLQTSGTAAAALAASPLWQPDELHARESGAGRAGRRNILMITCHDIGQHLGCYGVDTVHTEHIDALAKQGVRFENFFSTSAVCSPGRGSLLTGRYPQSNGLMGLTHKPWNWRLNDGQRHLAAILKEAGYRTTLVGLQHVTSGDPRGLGYDEVLSTGRRAEETVQAAKELFRKASGADAPFFAKVGFVEVHRRAHWKEDIEKGVFVPGYLKDTPAMREDLAAFQGSIRYFDRCVGEILEAVRCSAVADNTLIVLTSDHGIPYPGAKWTVRDAGIRVPLIMHCPALGLHGGKVYRQLISNVDVLPALLEMIGVEVPENVQGLSFKGLIDGDCRVPLRKEVFAQFTPDALRDNASRCVRTDRYMLIRYFREGRTVIYPADVHPQEFASHRQRCARKWGERPFFQLFDLQNDPHQLADLGGSRKHAELAEDLSARLWRWMEQVGDPLLEGPVRTPYYEKAMEDYRKFRRQR